MMPFILPTAKRASYVHNVYLLQFYYFLNFGSQVSLPVPQVLLQVQDNIIITNGTHYFITN